MLGYRLVLGLSAAVSLLLALPVRASLLTYDYTVAFDVDFGGFPSALAGGTGSGSFTINTAAPGSPGPGAGMVTYAGAMSSISFSGSNGIQASGHSDIVYIGSTLFTIFPQISGSSPPPFTSLVPTNIVLFLTNAAPAGGQLSDLPPFTFDEVGHRDAIELGFSDPFKSGAEADYSLTSLVLVSDIHGVPEPSTLGMLVIPLLALGWRLAGISDASRWAADRLLGS